jgi:lipopolysaccharide/colanic/teichoic acid biosynthesis glycosyltransferase
MTSPTVWIGSLMGITKAKSICPFWEFSFRPALIRFFDIIIGSVLMLIALPLCGLIAMAIKLTSPGPVFYSHYRMGRNRAPFKLTKFRTMIVNAEKDGPRWAEEHDQRITRIGRILRCYRMDELPQFLLVVKGDLSMVGPRPIREQPANILQQHASEYGKRFLVKPGLTGWAQLYAPYGSTVDAQLKKLPYDLRYLDGLLVRDYFRIILLTAKAVLLGRGC